MLPDYNEFLAGLASLVYGVLAMVLLFALALHQGSLTAMLLTVAAAGTTYVFQELQRHVSSPLLGFVMLVPPLLCVIAFAFIAVGA